MGASIAKRIPGMPSPATFLFGILVLLFYGSFLIHHIDLTVADLGRHIQNGRIAMEERIIPPTNFYSYTAPDYPVITHHWASGILFFLVWKAGGFTAVHLLFIAMSMATLAIFFSIASRAAGPGPAALITTLALPLLAERTEIRPEAISYLLSAVFFLLLLRNLETGFPNPLGNPVSKSRWPLITLPLLEVLWVNTHIYFFLGPVFIAIFLMPHLISRPLQRTQVIPLLWTLTAGAAATLINPFGLSGALAPFTIFQNYGYRIAENQPVWFVEKLIQNPNFVIFKILFWILAAGFAARVWIARKEQASAIGGRLFLPLAAIGIMISALAWLATRNFALFGFFFIPLIAANLTAFCGPLLARYRRSLTVSAALIVSLLFIPALFGQWQKYFPYWKEPGLGLERGNSRTAEFFKDNGLRGPIFNNYDIGGYLIWHLFPQEKVFVDNRPEAYPAAFFRDTYIPMQEREDAWQEALQKWQFNAIFFSHRDMTPWAQRFLIARIADRAWAPVYADRYAIIFLKRNDGNKAIIDRFEIPQSAFRIAKQ